MTTYWTLASLEAFLTLDSGLFFTSFTFYWFFLPFSSKGSTIYSGDFAIFPFFLLNFFKSWTTGSLDFDGCFVISEKGNSSVLAFLEVALVFLASWVSTFATTVNPSLFDDEFSSTYFLFVFVVFFYFGTSTFSTSTFSTTASSFFPFDLKDLTLTFYSSY